LDLGTPPTRQWQQLAGLFKKPSFRSVLSLLWALHLVPAVGVVGIPFWGTL